MDDKAVAHPGSAGVLASAGAPGLAGASGELVGAFGSVGTSGDAGCAPGEMPRATDGAAVAFDGIRFTYDGEAFVLDGIDLSVPEGQFLCILGGNGSGKATLARHINALLLPDEGQVTVLGWSTDDPRCTFDIRSHAGMVFQNPDDQLVASVVENDVAFGPENLEVAPDELQRRVIEALGNVGLQGFDLRETTALSGGQKQRVAIAGVLAMRPRILVLDEATAMLDPRGRKGLMRLARELNEQGLTVVMITHFMDEAAQADRVVVLEAGRVVADGDPDAVLSDPARLESMSLDVPFVASLAVALRKRGVDVAVHVQPDLLKEELCALRSSR